MSYIHCLKMAGAEILEHLYSGDYQGTLYVLCRHDGALKFLSIGYGSCGSCDSYQSWKDDFGWENDPTDEDFAEFGRSYLKIDSQPFEQISKRVKERSEWDLGSEEILPWLDKVEKYFDPYPLEDYSYGNGPNV